MRMLFLFILTFFSTLYGMENSPTHNSSFSPNNVYIYQKEINNAQQSNNYLLMAQLVDLCLPPEVIKTYIAPHFIKPIVTRYKHALIEHKGCFKLFKETTLNHNDEWDIFSRHDGAYSIVPKINTPYVTWNEKSTHTIHSCTYEEKPYTYLLISQDNQTKKSHFLITRNNHNNKKLIFGTDDLPKNKLNLSHSASHYCFSNNCTFLTIGFKENDNQSQTQTYNTTTGKGCFVIQPGQIENICSAHHLPLCAVTYKNTLDLIKPYSVLLVSSGLPAKVIIFNWRVTCTEFSPDDTQLLINTYNKTVKKSCVTVWGVSDLANIIRIWQRTYKQHILNATFIGNGRRIIAVDREGNSSLFNTLTGKHCSPWSNNGYSLNFSSNKHNLLIYTFKNYITIRESIAGNILAYGIALKKIPVGIGLTQDENSLVFIDKNKQAYQLALYDDQECSEINFIEKKANSAQLYEMFRIHKNNKFFERKMKFIPSIKSYLQKQKLT